MPEPEMRMDPLAVGRAARRWDDQHLDLHAAAVRTGASAAGFTPAVIDAAVEFALIWQIHTEHAASLCEARADGLRTTLADWVATDHSIRALLVSALGYLQEVR